MRVLALLAILAVAALAESETMSVDAQEMALASIRAAEKQLSKLDKCKPKQPICPGTKDVKPLKQLKKPVSNGCSADIDHKTAQELLHNKLHGKMSVCCDDHNLCYARVGSNKDKCDESFRQCLMKKCEASNDFFEDLLCEGQAEVYYQIVSKTACFTWEEAQIKNGCPKPKPKPKAPPKKKDDKKKSKKDDKKAKDGKKAKKEEKKAKKEEKKAKKEEKKQKKQEKKIDKKLKQIEKKEKKLEKKEKKLQKKQEKQAKKDQKKPGALRKAAAAVAQGVAKVAGKIANGAQKVEKRLSKPKKNNKSQRRRF
jgi:hypothetical protein